MSVVRIKVGVNCVRVQKRASAGESEARDDLRGSAKSLFHQPPLHSSSKPPSTRHPTNHDEQRFPTTRALNVHASNCQKRK